MPFHRSTTSDAACGRKSQRPKSFGGAGPSAALLLLDDGLSIACVAGALHPAPRRSKRAGAGYPDRLLTRSATHHQARSIP